VIRLDGHHSPNNSQFNNTHGSLITGTVRFGFWPRIGGLALAFVDTVAISL